MRALTAFAVLAVLAAVGPIAAIADPPMPSAHGCVGFDGTWQSPGGIMHLRNGSGDYEQTTLKGKVYGKVMRGTWSHPTVGKGTFMFILDPGGDSFKTTWRTATGSSGSFNTVNCIGPLPQLTP